MIILNAKALIKGASIVELWDAHSDIANWPIWQSEIEWTKIETEPAKGTKFTIKPKSGPKVNLEILAFDKPFVFTDVSYLPLAKMYTTTTMKSLDNGVEVSIETKTKGVLAFLWNRIVAKDIINNHQSQNVNMVNYIQSKK